MSSGTPDFAGGKPRLARPGMPRRRRVVARGRVQGVFFRDTVRRRAEELVVAGWVTNRDDGAVEAVFEGPGDAVEAMVELCRAGPGRAEVEDLEVSEQEPEGLNGFDIR
jgi:acylphosphatase